MSDPALSAMIREVLSEELAKLTSGNTPATLGQKRENARITNDAELNAFARRFLALMGDKAARRAFETGQLVFSLEGASSVPPETRPAASGAPGGPLQTIEQGFVSERHIDRLPNGVRRLELGKAARITPLARDRARQRGIVIERMKP